MTDSRIRRVASVLVRHAALIMPNSAARWGAAMASELDHIENDTDALGWALGCVWASYVARSQNMPSAMVIALRAGLAGLITVYALTQIPIVLMILGYKTGSLDLAAAMDGATAGDDYHRFVALMQQLSWLQLTGAIVEIIALLASAAAILAGWRFSPHLFGAAVVVHVAVWLGVQALPAFAQTFSAQEAGQDLIVMVCLLLAGAGAFWLSVQSPPSRHA